MYESFFHMTKRPFAATPQIEHYYPASSIEAARRTLVRCIDRAEGVGVAIGPSGTGKTLLCELLRNQFCDAFEVVLLGSTRLGDARALLQAILFELGLPCRGLDDGDLRLTLIDHLTNAPACQNGVIIIADEAHTLPARVLEEIRLITNISVDGQPRVRFVMAGGPALEEHLSSPRLASFSQRTAARCYLEPLDRRETADYVCAQMAAAGVEVRQVFTESALASIYRAADGIPRLINQVCDHALVLAFAAGIERLGEKEIEEAWADLQQLPTPWSGANAQDEKRAGTEQVVEFGQLDDDDDADSEPAHVGLRLAIGLADDDVSPEENLDRIEAALTSIEIGAPPRAATRVDVAHTANPFAERFAEEEVVVERFPSCHTAVWDQMPHVYSVEGRLLSSLLEPFVQTAKSAPVASKPAPVEATAADRSAWQAVADESDLIIVEDDPVIIATPRQAASRASCQEYSQLFAKLRRG